MEEEIKKDNPLSEAEEKPVEAAENVVTEKAEEIAPTPVEDDDDGFTDAPKPVVEEPKVEEKKEADEVAVDPHKVKDEDEKEELVKPSERDANGNIAYSDERFQTIEKVRKKHLKLVKKLSYIKVAITFGGLAIVLCGWLIPAYTMKDPGRIPTYIGLALAVLTVVAICVYGILSKKKQVKSTEEYLSSYFKECDEYLFEGLPISNLQGGMKEKITDDEFNGSDLYGPCSKHEEVSNIGSRDSLTFEYDGMKCALADVGAEARTPKGFLTVFIGKYLRTENHLTVDDGGLFVYIKGGPGRLPRPSSSKRTCCP